MKCTLNLHYIKDFEMIEKNDSKILIVYVIPFDTKTLYIGGKL